MKIILIVIWIVVTLFFLVASTPFDWMGSAEKKWLHTYATDEEREMLYKEDGELRRQLQVYYAVVSVVLFLLYFLCVKWVH